VRSAPASGWPKLGARLRHHPGPADRRGHPRARPRAEGPQARRKWLTASVDGDAADVAAARRGAAASLGKIRRKTADYLEAKTPFLDYPKDLAAGWPVVTVVIEAPAAT
jgi:hypothetical protein